MKTRALALLLACAGYCAAQANIAPPASARAGHRLDRDVRVSVTRLQHKVTHEVEKAFNKGMKLTNAGNWQKATAEFEKAVALDPEFTEALGNLGVCYVAAGRYGEALEKFRRAIGIDPATEAHHANAALALILLNRTPEAESEARTALSLDGANSKAHYLLGLALAPAPGKRAEAIAELRSAADAIPQANDVLAILLGAQDAGKVARSFAESGSATYPPADSDEK